MEISSNLPLPQFQNNPTTHGAQITQQFPDVLKTTAANTYVIPNTEQSHRTQINRKRLDPLSDIDKNEDDEPTIEQQVGTIIQKIKTLRTMEKNQGWTL